MKVRRVTEAEVRFGSLSIGDIFAPRDSDLVGIKLKPHHYDSDSVRYNVCFVTGTSAYLTWYPDEAFVRYYPDAELFTGVAKEKLLKPTVSSQETV